MYTEAQANRGGSLYVQQCSACHGIELTGIDEVPPLSGESFLSNWNGITVGDLFERKRISMPADRPGKLSRQQNENIVAYLLRFNQMPAGSNELGTNPEALKQVRFRGQAVTPD